MTDQFLIIDADDTLWENNVYFERAFDQFCDYLAHSSLNPDEIRAILDEIEIVNAKTHGYGSKNFARNLAQCYRRLCERHIHDDDIAKVMSFAEKILEAPMEIIPGVPETVEYLSQRHDLTLFTKGNQDEQRMKIDRSGLAEYFAHTAIVKEKDIASYQALVADRGFDPLRTWMIGNSPKSDVNPALGAGLNAVFVPHLRTWTLEREQLRMPVPPARLLIVESFSGLREHF